MGIMRASLFQGLLFFFLIISTFLQAQCVAKVGSNPASLNGCDPFTIQFNDISTGTVVNRTWKFGDGTAPSSSNNPVHTFTTTAKDTVYNVTLIIQCLNGSKDSISKQVTVYAKPTVDFTASKTTVCALNDSACFTIISPFGPGYNALWNFGDFTSSNLTAPCHVYGNDGLYNVDLVVTNTNGCLRSLTKVNYMNAVKLPSPDFTMSNFIGCAPLAVTFSNTTNTSSEPISQWEWDFDDGSPKSSIMNPGSHNYAVADTFFVKLKAVNSLGCYNTTTKVVQVKATPTASFSFSPTVCAGYVDQIGYTGSSLASATYSWEFDGAIVVAGSGKGPYQLKWDTAGSKQLALSVFQNGCSAQATYAAFVYAQPIVQLKSSAINDTACAKAIIKFTGQPQYYPKYNFYLNGVLSQSSADSVYLNANLNNGDIVTLEVQDMQGCINLIPDTLNIKIKPLPIVAITTIQDTLCNNSFATFYAVPKTHESYRFYDGFSLLQSGTSDSLLYGNVVNGSQLSVIATKNGCEGESAQKIKMTVLKPLPSPQVNCGNSTDNSIEFTWDPVKDAVGYEVSIDSAAFIVPSSGNTGLSHLITGLNQGNVRSIRVKALAGKPCFLHTVSSVATCTAVICSQVTYSTSPDPAVCIGQQADVFISAVNTPYAAIQWGNNAAGIDTTFSCVPLKDTTIFVKVINTHNLPICPAVVKSFSITVNHYPVVSLTSSAVNDSTCSGYITTFKATPAGLDQYDFYKGFSLVQSSSNPAYTVAQQPGTYTIKAVARHKGCTGTSSNTISLSVIKPIPVPQVVCSGSTLSSITYNWNAVPGAAGYLVSINGGTFITPSSGSVGLTHTVTNVPPGSSVTLMVKAIGYGVCGNSAISIPVTCFAEPCTALTYSTSGDVTICKGQAVNLSISNVNVPNYSVRWKNGTPGSNTSFTFYPSKDTLVSVSVQNTDESVCPSVTKYYYITVNPIPTPTLTSSAINDSTCAGSPVTFSVSPSGLDSYQFFEGFSLLQSSGNNIYVKSNLEKGKVINVSVTDKGCTSAVPVSKSLHVIQPLPEPTVNCGNTTVNSIQFVWDTLTGVSNYVVSIDGAPFITPSSGTNGLSHLIPGLNPGDIRSIRVMAKGGTPCNSLVISPSKTCSAINCNGVNFYVQKYDTICAGDTSFLSVNSINVQNYGVSWSGSVFANKTSHFVIAAKDSVVNVKVRDNLNDPACPTADKP